MPASCPSAPCPVRLYARYSWTGNIQIGFHAISLFGPILAAMRQRSRAIGHRAGIAQINATAARLPRHLTEQNFALGVHDWPAMPVRKWQLFSRSTNFGKDPNGKTDPCSCVCLYRPVFGFSPGRAPRNSAGTAGVFARRFALLPKTTGRRYGGPAGPAAQPAKNQPRASKSISKPPPKTRA